MTDGLVCTQCGCCLETCECEYDLFGRDELDVSLTYHHENELDDERVYGYDGEELK